ncbi:small ubiquitin-related modifier 2-like [Choloepus didactylus]|uniref:small ubiquitin-related modifier 2-like n=1 Tax=Choloepus didactylus TaxID=27675 RepID=UPI00189CF034|nr:small ubiquitin-related modifier 2-like [Choloepus didactylus]
MTLLEGEAALALAGEKHKEGAKIENNDHINLWVEGQDSSVVQFKNNRNIPLSKLRRAHCEQQDTSVQLEMEEEDTVDVFQLQSRGVY